MRSGVRIFMLSLSALLLGAAMAYAAEPSSRTEQPGSITLQTLDGDVQQVEIAEIWRIRSAVGREEPSGSVVIDYAFERIFVKDSLENIVGKVRDQHKIERFSLPSGAPIYIVTDKIIGIQRAIPGQHHEKSKSLIVAREGQQQVQESRDAIREVMQK